MKNYIVGAVAVLLLGALAFSVHDCAQRSALEAERQRVEAGYRAQMEAKDAEVAGLKETLRVMEQDYGFIRKKIKRIETERANLVAPKDLQELRARFTALGYPPVE